MLDWMPWNHVAGGSHNTGIAIYNGGTFYIDDGVPAPGRFAPTVRNLKEVQPTYFTNVPKAYEYLVAALEEDDEDLGGGARDGRAQVVLDQPEREVDASGDAGGCEQVAVAHEQRLMVDVHVRELAGERGGVAPVGCSPAAVEQPGGG